MARLQNCANAFPPTVENKRFTSVFAGGQAVLDDGAQRTGTAICTP
jgi:hypothetical protein